MPYLLLLPFILLCLTSHFSYADKDMFSHVNIPEELDVHYINGEKYGRFLFRKKSVFQLPKGENRLILKYKAFLGDGDNIEKVQSKPFMLVVTLDALKNYQLTLPNFKDVDEAKRYVKKPILKVIDVDNKVAANAKLIYQLEEKSYLIQLSAAKEKDSEDPKVLPISAETSVNALEQLNLWWNKASQEEREKFLKAVL